MFQKISNSWPFLIGLIFFIVKGPVSAQAFSSTSTADTLISPPMSEVVVSATRFSSRIKNTPEAISVVNSSSADELQLRSAPEALTIVPGVFVQKTNHGGGSPFLRGLTGNQTLLLLDGIRLSNSTMRYGPNQYLNTIDVFSIEKTEVLRGNGSVQYGSDAIGGTIQIFTPDLETKMKPELNTEFLSRFATHGMEKSFNLNLKYSNKFSAFRGGITYRNFGDLVGGDTTGRQTPTGYRELDYDFKGKIQISDRSSLTFVFQNVHQTEIPVFHKVALENYIVYKTDPQNRQLAYFRLNRELNHGILKSAAITGSYQHTAEGRIMRKNGSETSRQELDKVRTYGFIGELLFSKGRKWNGNLGIDVYSDLVNSSRTDTDLPTGNFTSKRGLYPDGSTMTSAAIFSVNTLDLDNWSFTAGARFNAYSVHVKDEETGLTRLNPSALVGNIGVLRKITNTSRLFFSLNTGFRAPNIDDLGTLGIVDFRYETPNLDLKPERSMQYQLGYRFYGQNLRGDFYVYRNELYDLITRKRIEDQSVDGYPLYRKENSDRAYIQGIESSWNLSVNRFLDVNGSLTYTFGQNITNKEPLRRIPPLFGRVAAGYRFEALRFGIEWLAAGKQDRLAQGDIDDNRIPDGGTPGWDIFNINSGYSWKYMNIDFCINNIFNKDYRYHGSGINSCGRSAFLTLRINI
jgi:outer membrane receptor protein involved in Fe transport